MSTPTPSVPLIHQSISLAHSDSWASHNGNGDVRFERGQGVWLYNSQGEAYLDAVSGTFNLPLGYSHPVVLEAVRRQQERVVHLSSTFVQPYTRDLIDRLREHAGEEFASGWFRDITGSTANECAIRMAQKATGASGVISLFYSHHGQTHLMTGISANARRRRGFPGSHTPFSLKVPAPYCSRCFYNARYPSCDLLCINRIDDFLDHAGIGDTACLIVEPILGNGENIVPPKDYFPRLREFCSARGIVLIADEVQTGIGRTGHMFASLAWGLDPDIIVLGKGLGGIGFPMAGVLMRRHLDVLESFEHSFTSGAYVVGIAAALATIDVITRPGFLAEVRRNGEYLGEKLSLLVDRFDFVREARGTGMMWGLEIVTPTGQPNAELTNDIVQRAFADQRLILRSSRYGRGNVIKVRPALITNRDELNEIVTRLEACFRSIIHRM
jgi:4-aminobutyrate aminotransferase